MKRIPFNKKQETEMRKIAKFFLEATEILEPDKHLRAAVDVKILSRLAALSDRLVGHLDNPARRKKTGG